ncbi:uncharacterized protein C9orf85 homolog [Pararge aegeria]|uniref:Jg10851 protein n=2 Tax=Pararge aegeria TaxID=116150 RepID=A0A8S4SFX9_9NEOP|nr:uncharacterized protein C9orf85 homolog [Pararge aegeria]CAH2263074.1 jg10851 [Pararge aegeria aegeria]
MSCARGNTIRNRPQKHKNKTTFKNDLHDTSKKTKVLNNLEVNGVCERCKEIIQWKIKYKKYKTLTAPRKCVGCEQKNVKYAYHVLCKNCATQKCICAKCCKPFDEIQKSIEENEANKYQSILKNLPERKRRTLLRYIKKQQDGQETSSPTLEALLSEIDKINFDDDDGYDDDDNNSKDCSSEENLQTSVSSF